MLAGDFTDNDAWRLAAYKELVSLVNSLFSNFLGDYCCNCQSVIGRLAEAENEAFVLLEGVYPGCCHRGAGDIFRLEGQDPERMYLASVIISGLQRERELRLKNFELGTCGGTYRLRRQRDDSVITGAHCRYFSAAGCTLGVLKGPLCINFICPPMRSDLLVVCAGDDRLVGPEHDFMFIYRSLAIISYDCRDEVEREILLFRRKLQALEDKCTAFLIERQVQSLFSLYN